MATIRIKVDTSYRIGDRFVKNGRTMQIISVNPDGTATYSEVETKTRFPRQPSRNR